MREFDVVVVGAGPAGIFTALELQKGSPNARVLIVDAGSSIDRRNCPARRTGKCVGCTPCAIMQGWPARARSRTASSPFPRRWAATCPITCRASRSAS